MNTFIYADETLLSVGHSEEKRALNLRGCDAIWIKFDGERLMLHI